MSEIEVSKYPIQLMSVDELKPYPLNSKVHTEENITGLVSSISRHGMSNPITVDKNKVIIGGHGRLEACKRLGKKVVEVRMFHDLSAQKVKELRIAENKTASTEYDSAILKLELAEIDFDEIDITSLGFDKMEFEKLTADYNIRDEDAFTENLNDDVDRQTEEGERDIQIADLKLVPVATGLGFKFVSVDATRKIARFVADLQEQYELEDPALAFVKFVEEMAAA
jgi:ParB-like chromosome segregation protein Spo0J